MKHPEIFAYAGKNTDAKGTTDAAGNTFYFSYRTLVGFQRGDGPLVVHQNDWGKTTGKHLNAIDGGNKDAKAKRLNASAFEAAYLSAFNRPGLPGYSQEG